MRRIVQLLMVAVLICVAQQSGAADAKPMTNQDVINLVKAKLPADTVVMAVKAAKPNFDTSADGLIKLQGAGVPGDVIEAMIAMQSGVAAASNAAAPAGGTCAASAGGWNPEEIILVDGGERIPMRYLTPQMRSAVRALGYGGMAQYAVLRGNRASLRLKGNQPEFLLAVPNNAQPDSYFTLVNMAVRKNNSREIMVGGGYMSYSSGVATDRVIATVSEKLADQSGAPKGFITYRIKVASPLPPGEYAVVLYNSQIRTVGFLPRASTATTLRRLTCSPVDGVVLGVVAIGGLSAVTATPNRVWRGTAGYSWRRSGHVAAIAWSSRDRAWTRAQRKPAPQR